MSPPSVPTSPSPDIRSILDALAAVYRDETWHWMPDHIDGPMDIIAGAILVQHTNWTNAERALEALRSASALEPEALASMPTVELAALVRVSGTPTIKARRLQAVASTIVQSGGLEALFALPGDVLRSRLLATHGIGPETADAIALYAAGRRLFVIDAYTRRLFRRIGIGPIADTYDAWQRMFHEALGAYATVDEFRRFHAHIVLHSKHRCRATPRCDGCVLQARCAAGIVAA